MPPRARDYQPGERLPGTVYQVVRLIGAGGMGTVYDVLDTTVGKRFVLKTLLPQLGARDDLARRMQKEARTLGKLNHTNIVEVITAGVTADELRLPYYVMERLNGQSLRLVLEKKGQLELPHAYQIGIDLLDALDHAHGEGVIHRDIKPDNIFLHRTLAGLTVTKLIDFGIQALLHDTTRDTARRFLGTLRYAAPEQLRGDPATTTVDIYAAGLVLYEMIAGRGPFDEYLDAASIGAAHMHKAPPPLSHFVEVPGELEALVMAAIAKSSEERPADAFAFAVRLRDLKRALPGPRSREWTEVRATAPVLLPPSAMAAHVDLRAPVEDGRPYVISPVARARIEGGSPRTTVVGAGVSPPFSSTFEPRAASGIARAAPATKTEPVDRGVETNSFAPFTLASPRHGTEALEPPDGSPQLEDASPPSSIDATFRWPDERSSAMSEAAHVRTLSAGEPRSSRAGLRMVTAVAFLGAATIVAGLFFARTSLVASRARTGSADDARPRTTAQPASLAPEPNASTPPADAPAVSPSASSSQTPASAASIASSAPARRKPRAAASSAAAKAVAPDMRTDRPGPGF
jgi:eukaryotic-like serine/threonine-protein kinase